MLPWEAIMTLKYAKSKVSSCNREMRLEGDYRWQTSYGHKIDKKNLQNVAFQIDIATHLKKEDFLVVTFNLTNGINHPYKKPNVKLLHVQFSSSYPLQIIKG